MRLRDGKACHDLATQLFPICRSITGNGVRETLSILSDSIPLKVHEVKSGTKAFDWRVPDEWNIRDAYVANSKGERVIDFKKHTLHVVGYSEPVDRTMTRDELENHLHSLPGQPDAIPYVTSYYRRTWGFCLSHNDRKKLSADTYRVRIDSTLARGHLTYADVVIPGETKEEIFFSTYICHPSMANNELSGPVLAAALAQYVALLPRRYTYRFAFIPETIGSIVYASRNLKDLQKNTVACFVLSCLGDEGRFSFIQSKHASTYADRVARRILKKADQRFVEYSFLQRGSDERQYGFAGINLPTVTLCRSRFTTYPEYHTSLDNLSFVTPRGLQKSLSMLISLVNYLESNRRYRSAVRGEPQLGKRGLYKTDPKAAHASSFSQMLLDCLAYADGSVDEACLCEILGVEKKTIRPVIKCLIKEKLLRVL